MKLYGELESAGISICALSEHRLGMGIVDDSVRGWKLVTHGEENSQIGVAVAYNQIAAASYIDYKQYSPRIVSVSFRTKVSKLHFVAVYAPQIGNTAEIRGKFFADLQDVVDSFPRRDMIVIAGDINAKVGTDPTRFPGAVGKHGFDEQVCDNGKRFGDFLCTNQLKATNTWFQHKELHKWTYQTDSGSTRSTMDYICINKKFSSFVTDSRVYAWADMSSDHRLVVANLRLKLKKVQRAKWTPKLDVA